MYDPNRLPCLTPRRRQATPRFVKALSIIIAAATGASGQTFAAAAPAPAERPNVVLIFIDDMGYGDIGPFGNKVHRTPNLDRMAAEGMKFHSFYATPVCSMSRAALMTGCYNARVSMPGVLFPGSNIGLHPDETTAADLLKSQGYATMCIGKWHLGHREPFLPMQQGFDAYFGIPYSNDMTIDPKNAKFAADCVFREGMTAEKARGEPIKNTVPLMRGDAVVEYPADQSTLTKRYTDEGIRFIREHRDGPFFLYMPHTMVHYPLAASETFLGKSAGGLLGDAVEELDWSVGQILSTLNELKLDEKTLVIFTSDNGAAAGSSLPFRGKKGSNFEGGVREPCIMRWPGRIPAGTDCRQIAGNIDVLPTLAALAGAAPAADGSLNGKQLDGRDISSLMFQPDGPAVRETHLYYSGEKLQAYRRGAWKVFFDEPLVRGQKKQSGPPQPHLFNLADDPYETKNVAVEKPDLLAELIAEGKRRGDEVTAQKRPIGRIGGEEERVK